MPSIAKDNNVAIWQPYWANASNDWWMVKSGDPAGGGALGAGVVFQTTIPHPFAAIGEQYVEIKCNNADHRLPIVGYAISGGSSADNTKRWAGRVSFLCQFTATNPAADRIIWDNDPNGTIAGTANYRAIKWVAGTKTIALYTGATPTLQQTSLVSVPATTDIQMEVWEVYKDSAGNTLPAVQIVVRYATLVAGSPSVMTTLINVQTSISLGGGVPFVVHLAFGEKVADANDARFYVGNGYSAIENADDPYGVIRVDRMQPDSNGGRVTQWGNDFNQVKESGTAVPDDATTQDTGTVINGTIKQLYNLSAQHTAAGDSIMFPSVGLRDHYSGTLSKGTTESVSAMISDGTTDVVAAELSTAATTYENQRVTFLDKPGGTGWTNADLTNLQAGHQGISSSTNLITFYCSTDTVLVAYQASGETTGAVVHAPPKVPSLFVRQAVNRAGAY